MKAKKPLLGAGLCAAYSRDRSGTAGSLKGTGKGVGMKRKVAYLAIFCMVLVVILALAAGPVAAIVGGEQDTDNDYANVGMLATEIEVDDGVYWWLPHGSVTLVKNEPDEVIVLTAAHCVDWLFDEDGEWASVDTYVSFQPMTTLGQWDVIVGGMSLPTYRVTAAAMHPDYVDALATPYRGNSKMLGIGPGREDVALLWLEGPVPDDLKPATIVSECALDDIDRKSATFTVVGYGINGYVTGNTMSRGSLDPTVPWSGRNYREGVSVVTEHDAFGDRYLKLTTCVGSHDSGGPTFYEGKIAAVNVWADSMRMSGHAYPYRLDTARAQWFLDPYLGD